MAGGPTQAVKARHESSNKRPSRGAAGPGGAALAPPYYGIPFVDQGSLATPRTGAVAGAGSTPGATRTPTSPSAPAIAPSRGPAAEPGDELEADAQRIVAILDEWHYSDSDEQAVIAILARWAPIRPSDAGDPATRLNGLDRLFLKLTQRTTSVGILGERTSYYSLMFNHFDRRRELRDLRDSGSMLFHGDAGIAEVRLAEQDVMATASAAWQPVKTRLYEGLISELRTVQAAGLGRLRAMVRGWPPMLQRDGNALVDQIQACTDCLVSLVLAVTGLAVGFSAGMAKLVWGLIEFLLAAIHTLLVGLLANFSNAAREQLKERISVFLAALDGLGPALVALVDRWCAEWDRADADHRTLMIGELTGEIEAFLASLLAAGEAAAALPKAELAISPARALGVIGGTTATQGGAITVNIGALGPPAIAGGLAGAYAMAVSQDGADGGGPQKPPAGKAPAERTPEPFTPGVTPEGPAPKVQPLSAPPRLSLANEHRMQVLLEGLPASERFAREAELREQLASLSDDLAERALRRLEIAEESGTSIFEHDTVIERPKGSPRRGQVHGDLGEARSAAERGATKLPRKYSSFSEDLRSLVQQRLLTGKLGLRSALEALGQGANGIKDFEVSILVDGRPRLRKFDDIIPWGEDKVKITEVKTYLEGKVTATPELLGQIDKDLAILEKYGHEIAELRWRSYGKVDPNLRKILVDLEKEYPGQFVFEEASAVAPTGGAKAPAATLK